jgi:perosamine synthetase
MVKLKIPFFIPEITNDDKQCVMKALDAPMLTDGPKLREFEKNFAKYTGSNYAVGVSNATSALHLSIKALGIGKGDEVIVPDITFVATINAVLACDATPVLADVNKEDSNISVKSIKNSITSKTKLIIPVHIAGKICDIKEIKKIADKEKIAILEDCAHAIGTRLNKKHVGLFGKMGCFSFYPTKNITTIEGGMVITNSKRIAKYVASMRNHGLTKTLEDRFSKGKPWNFDVIEPGFNYRLDEIRASLGINQLKRIEKVNNIRKKISDTYNDKLSGIEGILTPQRSKNKEDSHHLYRIRVTKEFRISRDELFFRLRSKGVSTSLHYRPLHDFQAYKKIIKNYDKLNNANQIYNETLSLPLYTKISKKQQEYVIKCIKNV